MTWKTERIIMAAIIGLPVAGALAAVAIMVATDPGRCIASEPMICTGGKIYTSGGGMFGSPVVMYQLDYPGSREQTGESCSHGVDVTQAEYDRQMYRH